MQRIVAALVSMMYSEPARSISPARPSSGGDAQRKAESEQLGSKLAMANPAHFCPEPLIAEFFELVGSVEEHFDIQRQVPGLELLKKALEGGSSSASEDVVPSTDNSMVRMGVALAELAKEHDIYSIDSDFRKTKNARRRRELRG
jgi:hypothetical protein